jgi:hypothetical protein
MANIYDLMRPMPGLVPQSLASTNATGQYYLIQGIDRVAAYLVTGAMATGNTVKVELLQATSYAGGSAKVLASGSNYTITANTSIMGKCLLTYGTPTGGDNLVINTLTYSYNATPDVTQRRFSTAANLITAINDPTYGVPGVIAVANGGNVDIISNGAAVSVTGSTNITASTTQAMAIVDCPTTLLDSANSFAYVAVKVTTTGTILVATETFFYSPKIVPSLYGSAQAQTIL